MNNFKTNFEKFSLYILSLWLLFFLMFIVTVRVPTCFEKGCSFIGWYDLVTSNYVAIISIIFLLFGLYSYCNFKFEVAGSSSITYKINKREDINFEHLTFLTTYIIPLICFNLESARYLIALGVLLLVIGIIYIRTDKFYANPTLAVLGFRIYEMDISNSNDSKNKIIIITKNVFKDEDYISIRQLDEKFYYGRKK